MHNEGSKEMAIEPRIIVDGEVKRYYCPGCEEHLLSTKNCRMSGSRTRYCADCGQKLDWNNINLGTYWPLESLD